MSRVKRISFLAFLAILATTSSVAQIANSPFSSFGVGDLHGTSFAQNQGMGGVGISNPSSWYINNQNPALLTYNFVTTFQAGMILENRTVNDGSSSVKNTNGNLNYLALAFPVLSGRWTTSLGLMPYSTAKYKFTVVEPVLNDQNTTLLSQKTGTGGLTQFYWSNGVKINKYLALGARASYFFGSIESDETQTLNQNRLVLFYPLVKTLSYAKGFGLSPAIYLHKDSISKKNFRISVGAVYDFKSNLKSEISTRIDQRSFRGQINDSTTISNEGSTLVLPQTYGGGISFGRPGFWTLAADLTILDYNQFKDFNGKTAATTTGIRSGVGFEYTPDQVGVSNYLRRITYRTGVSYEKYPYLVGSNEIKDYGINFGVSLPVGSISTIDLSLKVGKRGSILQNSIDENYFKLYFGMTFNDRWFIKRKFD